MEIENATFFKEMFPWKEAWENHLVKRMIDDSSSNHYQSEDDKIKLKKSKKTKITKNIWSWFFNILLENEHQTYSEAMSWKLPIGKKVVNNEIEFIMNNQIWKLVDLSPGSK